MSRPTLIETEKYYGCRDRDRWRLGKRCRDGDFIESLADLWGVAHRSNSKEIFPFLIQKFVYIDRSNFSKSPPYVNQKNIQDQNMA